MKKHNPEQLQMWAKENGFSRWIYDGSDKKPFRKSKKRVDFKHKKRYK